MVARMKFLAHVLTFAMLLLAAWISYGFYLYRAPSNQPDTTITIERGTGTLAMLNQLYNARLIPTPWKIMPPVLFDGDYRRMKAGEYAFEERLSPAQILHHIARGQVVVHAVTIPEGFSVAQVRAVLMDEPLLIGKLPLIIPEGSVAPDTLHFQRGDTRASVLSRLQGEQQDILEMLWQKRADDLPFTTAEEALVLASIVEEETGVQDERGRVAAVYINRLRMGMPLQADPTVAYGIAPHGLDRPLTRADLKRDSPYNTYLRKGLPRTPICNPGRASIRAVLNPPATEDLFFVATGTGGHYFARTLKEHNQNVARYRASLNAQR